ncbi:hypothetical protein H0H93_016791 [Arthromyces matolae]|nr:hypothetical protein H0H93_016791 [Arthromyces matolae]
MFRLTNDIVQKMHAMHAMVWVRDDKDVYINVVEETSDDIEKLESRNAERYKSLVLETLRVVHRRSSIVSSVSTIFNSKDMYRRVLSYDDGKAQNLVDTLQLLLDTQDFHEIDRKSLIAALQRFSKTRNIYPLQFFLKESIPSLQEETDGSGGFADVYKVKFRGVDTCFKVIRVDRKNMEHLAKAYAKEAIVWAQLHHPNVLPFYGIFQAKLIFVSRWATNGDVNHYLEESPNADRILLCADIATGVEYLHKNDIVHGDLKGPNILIDDSGRALIADFGLANISDPFVIKWTSQSTVASIGGTTRWQAPELFQSEDEKVYNTKASDVFAWSSVCYEIFTGLVPFHEFKYPATVMNKIMQGRVPTRPNDLDPAWEQHGLNNHIWSLMEHCWSFQPSDRPDMMEVISKLGTVKPEDTRPPGRSDDSASMHFRIAQRAREVENSLEFWEGVRGFLSEIVAELSKEKQLDRTE